MRLDVHFHTDQLDRIEALLRQFFTEGRSAMTAITDALDGLNTKVAALETAEASAIALLTGLKAALVAALALGDPAAIVAGVQAVADKIGTDTDALAAAVAANT